MLLSFFVADRSSAKSNLSATLILKFAINNFDGFIKEFNTLTLNFFYEFIKFFKWRQDAVLLSDSRYPLINLLINLLKCIQWQF